ncbi:MAG TPA: hypothetical protein VLD61_02175, partial [Methylomirabilota bacterium]|nr:hypothetical protein [Methylomirabilota bacterium]
GRRDPRGGIEGIHQDRRGGLRSLRAWALPAHSLLGEGSAGAVEAPSDLLAGLSPLVVVAILTAGGALACSALVRLAAGTRALLWILLAAQGVRVGLTVLLYVVSVHRWPILPSLHVPGGFWSFALDAPAYHENGLRIAAFLHAGEGFPLILVYGAPFLVEGRDFFDAVGVLYWVLGPHPLYVPLINAILWSAAATLGYVLARDLRDEAAGRLAAGLVAFWPSGLLWSSQLLKDSLMVALLLLAVLLAREAWGARGGRAVAAGLGLMLVAFVLTRNRVYFAQTLIVSAGLAAVAALPPPGIGRGRAVLRGLVVVLVLIGSYAVARETIAHALRQDRAAAILVYPPKAREPRVTEGAPAETRRAPATLLEHLQVLSEAVADRLNRRRQAFLTYHGSQFAPDVRFHDLGDVVGFLPAGLLVALYGPLPWQWFPLGSTGMLKVVSGGESFLLLVLTPMFLVATGRGLRTRRFDAWLIVLTAVILLIGLGLTVPNLGAIFRLRLASVVLFAILGAAWGTPSWARRVVGPR